MIVDRIFECSDDGKQLLKCVDKYVTSVVIPDSVTSIGDGAFEDCASLTSVKIPDSVTVIGDSVFDECTSLISIDVSENNQQYCSVEGVLFSKDRTRLISYPAGKGDVSYTVPDSVISIEDGAFYNCTSLTSVIIGNSVTSIGDSAFASCASLTSVIIPDSVVDIESAAFPGGCNLRTCKKIKFSSSPDTKELVNNNF